MGIAIAVAAAAALLVVIVPVAQTDYEWFTIVDPGDGAHYYGQNQTFPAAGTFHYVWQSNSTSGVTFQIVNQNGFTLLSVVNDSGSGFVSVSAGSHLLFEISTSVPQTVTVSGSLHFVAPLL